jgi:hypothetical protein
VNEVLAKLYRASRPKEALASQDEFKSANALLGTDVEKFAELIVQKCAEVFEAEVDTWKEMDPYQGSIKRQGTKAIKQHFGVE